MSGATKKDQDIKDYAAFLRQFASIEKPLRIIFDCSNGTTGGIISRLVGTPIKNLKAEFINYASDGNFPAHGPNPLTPHAMDEVSDRVVKEQADAGVIFDADGDRVFFIDDRSRLVGPDMAAILIGGQTKGPAVLTVTSGLLVRDVFASEKRKIFTSRVGHYFIKKMMREKKASFGAEHSGHYYFKDFFYCDSGILATILFLKTISVLGDLRLSQWIDFFPPFYQSGEINFSVKDKEHVTKLVAKKFSGDATRVSDFDGLRIDFASSSGRSWFNLRPSNTEGLLRFNAESENEETLRELVERVRTVAEKY